MTRLQICSKLVLGLALLGPLSGCVLAPLLQGVEDSGAFEGDRQALLYKELRNFHNARYWNSVSDMANFMHPEAPEALAKQIMPKKKEERITESEVDGVTFSPNSYEADVDVTVKAYKLKTYIVEDRAEHQVWKFRVGVGWKLLSLHNVPS